MAVATAFSEAIEALLVSKLEQEYPHMTTTGLRNIAGSATRALRESAKAHFRHSAKKARKLCFFDLPPEMRNTIYRYALIRPGGKLVDVGLDGMGHAPLPDVEISWLALDEHARQPGLTRVSRRLRAETLPMFYGLNTFILSLERSRFISGSGRDGPSTGAAWTKAIGTSNISKLRKLKVVCRNNSRPFMTNVMSWKEFCDQEGLDFSHASVQTIE